MIQEKSYKKRRLQNKARILQQGIKKYLLTIQLNKDRLQSTKVLLLQQTVICTQLKLLMQRQRSKVSLPLFSKTQCKMHGV